MGSNGNHKLRILLSGEAAGRLAGSLPAEPALTLVEPPENGRAAAVDVVLHVLHSSHQHNDQLSTEIDGVRAVTDAPLILAAYGEPNGISEAGLRVGAADVLVLPQPEETLLFALRKAARVAARTSGKVITVFSPKGGTGKTVLATNLAAAASQSRVETLLVDCDLQFGDSALTTSIRPRATIADLASAQGQIDQEKLLAFVSRNDECGLTVLPAPLRPEEADAVGRAELQAILDTARSSFEAVVIDTGPLFDAALLTALERTDELLLVCNPEITSLKNVRIGLDTIDRLGFDRERVSIVANRIGSPGAVSRTDIEQALGTDVRYELPDDPAVPAAINRALPVVLADPRCRFSHAVQALAAQVVPGMHAETNESAEGGKRRFLTRGRR
jgi:MinD-like ATPase involved in chromosome partitioning or flagellar assembly